MRDGYDVIPATEEAIRVVAKNLRGVDRRDISAYSTVDPESQVVADWAMSTRAWVGTFRRQPLCAFGVLVAPGVMASHAMPWFRGTRQMEPHWREVVRMSRHVVLRLLDDYETLSNFIDAGSSGAIRWLEWSGFNVDPEILKLPGVCGVPVRRYWARRAK